MDPPWVIVPAAPRANASGLNWRNLTLSTARQALIPALLAAVPHPLGFIRALPPLADSCAGLAKPSVTGGACAWAVNAGPFATIGGGGCVGGLVSDGRLIESTAFGNWSNSVRWGLTASGHHVFGPLTDANATSLGVQQLVGECGGGLLVHRGVPSPAIAPGGKVAPRTALGVTASGGMLLLTVDGADASKWHRAPSGMTMRELAEALASLGASEAINLDGGGSTSASEFGQLRDRPTCLDLPKVVCERAVSSVLCVSGA